MRVVLIGDIGRADHYHLGDEAMSEAAIDILRSRGITEITAIATDPEITTTMYGVHAVARIGFDGGRPAAERRLAELERELAQRGRDRDTTPGPWWPATVVDAVAGSDAVLIAGGGNINSQNATHLHERLALTRIARHFGVPLFVAGQTLGPVLRPADRKHVEEIVGYATTVAARERQTLGLARDLGGRPGQVVHTMDDAMLLDPRAEDERVVAELGLPDRYVVASFVEPTIGRTLHVADVLDRIAERFDVDVVLAPHEGGFPPMPERKDQLTAREVLERSRNGRVRYAGMLTARQVIALTRGAVASVSSRYHPAVFAPAVGTPAITVAPTYYSLVRMRGALANVGMGSYALPTDAWHSGLWERVLDDLMERYEEIRDRLTRVAAERRSFQIGWWDAVVDSMSGTPWPGHPDLPDVPTIVPGDGSAGEIEAVTRLSEKYFQEQALRSWDRRDIQRLGRERDEARRRSNELEHRLAAENAARARSGNPVAAARRLLRR